MKLVCAHSQPVLMCLLEQLFPLGCGSRGQSLSLLTLSLLHSLVLMSKHTLQEPLWFSAPEELRIHLLLPAAHSP